MNKPFIQPVEEFVSSKISRYNRFLSLFHNAEFPYLLKLDIIDELLNNKEYEDKWDELNALREQIENKLPRGDKYIDTWGTDVGRKLGPPFDKIDYDTSFYNPTLNKTQQIKIRERIFDLKKKIHGEGT